MELAHNNDVPSKVNILGQLHFLTSSAFLRPFRCVGIIYMLSQLSGLLIINVYTLTYLEGQPYNYSCILSFITTLLYILAKIIIFLQAASGNIVDFLSPKEGAIALGTFELVASLLGPLLAIKVPKKSLFIMSGALISLSLVTGSMSNIRTFEHSRQI